jgi:hypothetical protein
MYSAHESVQLFIIVGPYESALILAHIIFHSVQESQDKNLKTFEKQ